MKNLILWFICAFVVSAYGASLDIYDGPIDHLGEAPAEVQRTLVDFPSIENIQNYQPQFRARRVTCDVLSFETLWLSAKDSACAIRCLTQKRKGGMCQNGVCVCR